MADGRRTKARASFTRDLKMSSMRDNCRSPGIFPNFLRNFPQFPNQLHDSKEGLLVPFSLLYLRFLKKQSLATRSIVRARHAIYWRATIFHASRPVVNTRYLRMQTYRHTQCATFTVLENSQRPNALRFRCSTSRNTMQSRGAIKGDVSES